jgi:hypothetical protein
MAETRVEGLPIAKAMAMADAPPASEDAGARAAADRGRKTAPDNGSGLRGFPADKKSGNN